MRGGGGKRVVCGGGGDWSPTLASLSAASWLAVSPPARAASFASPSGRGGGKRVRGGGGKRVVCGGGGDWSPTLASRSAASWLAVSPPARAASFASPSGRGGGKRVREGWG